MSQSKTAYVAREADENQWIYYNNEENQIWSELIEQQAPMIQGRACREFMQGLQTLNLPKGRIPQCGDVSEILKKITGWSLEAVPALIPFEQFFRLLANRKFPAATFIRSRNELNYLKEPDIFHEIFGHGPLLTHPRFAEFMEVYGELGLRSSAADRIMLARLYWFTVEFGLIETSEGLRAYGGGILSSIAETQYSLESVLPLRKPFELLDVLRTPYRIDIMQPIYYVLNSFEQLFELTSADLLSYIQRARKLGDHSPVLQISSLV